MTANTLICGCSRDGTTMCAEHTPLKIPTLAEAARAVLDCIEWRPNGFFQVRIGAPMNESLRALELAMATHGVDVLQRGSRGDHDDAAKLFADLTGPIADHLRETFPKTMATVEALRGDLMKNLPASCGGRGALAVYFCVHAHALCVTPSGICRLCGGQVRKVDVS